MPQHHSDPQHTKRLSRNEYEKRIPDPKSVRFDPFNTGILRAPQVVLPGAIPESDCHWKSAYNLFSLFWPDHLWAILAENTNRYRGLQRTKASSTQQRPRPWHDTSANELKVWVEGVIYMAVHHSPAISNYWNTDISRRPRHTISCHMSQVRFEQIRRYLHISKPRTVTTTSNAAAIDLAAADDSDVPDSDEDDSDLEVEDADSTFPRPGPVDEYGVWWYKLIPLIYTFREACRSRWTPGSSVAIDEMMIKSHGRSPHTIFMPSKPISKGYKMWALCERGYLSNFMYSSPRDGTGELQAHPNLSDTGAMVAQMGEMLPKDVESPYTLYLDNDFTSIDLFQLLRDRDIGACGTTSARRTKFPPFLQAFKDKLGDRLPWRTLAAIPVDDVLCLGWSDNQAVMVLSTVHTVDKDTDAIVKNRRRPSGKPRGAKNARRVFENEPHKELSIHRFINDYNHYMGGVDIADQFRDTDEKQRKALRNWFPLFFWVIDHAIINAFKVGCRLDCLKDGRGRKYWKATEHQEFREVLYYELLAFSASKQRDRAIARLGKMRLNTSLNHRKVKDTKRVACEWCSFCHSTTEPRPITQATRTYYRCEPCNAHLCDQGPCFEAFHQEVQPELVVE